MAAYGPAFEYMMDHEDRNRSGIVTGEPKGGQARFGLNSRANPDLVEKGFYTMPHDAALAMAKVIYYNRYWQPAAVEQLQSQRMASKIFDCCVNESVGHGIKIAQQAANDVAGHAALAVDGVLGPQSVELLDSQDEEHVLRAIVARSAVYHRAVYDANPQAYSPGILNNWICRDEDLPT